MSVLSHEECLRHLRASRVGRLGLSIGMRPTIHPVDYAVLGESVLLRVPAHGELHRASAGHQVAFEIDGFDTARSARWYVVVQGTPLEVEPDARLRDTIEGFDDAAASELLLLLPTDRVSGEVAGAAPR